MFVQTGCFGPGNLQREREGKQALDMIRLKDGETKSGAESAKDDLLRRYEAETSTQSAPPGPKERPLSKAERDRQEAEELFREHMKKQSAIESGDKTER